MDKIPVSVLVVTKNEEAMIEQCLDALSDFDEVIVVDSLSSDRTVEIALDAGVRVVDFEWDEQYPKKRQWCLDNLQIRHDWVFWVDADEVLTSDLIAEIRMLDFQCVGYFVKGQYILNGRVLKYGMQNNKIALFNRKRMTFPVVDDLDCPDMGEIEGHYQPVLRRDGIIGQLNATLLHYANQDAVAWTKRHERYARWEVYMARSHAWPKDPVWWREWLKRCMRSSRFRPYVLFMYSYICKLGFLDGRAGYEFAQSRKRYCEMVLAAAHK